MPTVDAHELFAPLGPSADRVGAALSLGQDPLWRRFLVSRLPRDRGHVLDVATGTGLVAAELLRRGFRVTGLDPSPEMLAVARRRFGDHAPPAGSLGGRRLQRDRSAPPEPRRRRRHLGDEAVTAPPHARPAWYALERG